MATWILIKTQLKNKKSAYISIFILTFIIAYIFSLALSFTSNVNQSAMSSFDSSDFGEIIIYFQEGPPSEEGIEELKALDEVGRVRRIPFVATTNTEKASVNGKNLLTAAMQVYDRELLPLNVFNEDANGYIPAEELKPLKKGELYLPIKYRNGNSAEIGDELILKTESFEKHFKIVGFVESLTEVNFLMIGNDDVYIGEEDYSELIEIADKYPEEFLKAENLRIDRSEAYKDMDLAKLTDLITDKTGITANATFVLTKDRIVYFASVLPNIIAILIMAAAGLVFIASLLVLYFNINNSIESEYKNIGVLKACGLKSGRIKAVYLLSFVFVIALAFLSALLLAYPSYLLMAPHIVDIVCLLTKPALDWQAIIISFLAMLCFVAILLLLQLRRTDKIKPREALNEGKQSVYFSKGIKATLKQPFLKLRLSVKQMSASFGQYLSSILIIAVLFFLSLYVYSLTNLLTEDRIMKDFYGFDFHLDVSYDTKIDLRDEVEAIIEDESPIVAKYPYSFSSLYMDGNLRSAFIMEDMAAVTSLLEGRLPENKNEILLTKLYKDKMGIEIGDEVELKHEGHKGKFIVSGFYQTINMAGELLVMSSDAMEALNPEYEPSMHYFYLIEDRAKDELIKEKIDEEYENFYISTVTAVLDSLRPIALAFEAMTVAMFAVAIIFVVISSVMLAGKIFSRESADFGIYKALGIRNGSLRQIFSWRFVPVSLIGVGLGGIISLLLAPKVNNLVMGMMGLSTVEVQVEAAVVLIFVLAFILAFFGIAYMVSRKIERLEVKDLLNAL